MLRVKESSKLRNFGKIVIILTLLNARNQLAKVDQSNPIHVECVNIVINKAQSAWLQVKNFQYLGNKIFGLCI